jgi:zinc finger protein
MLMAKQKMDEGLDILEGQRCPMCLQEKLTLMEYQREVPFFGKAFFFSMDCSNCGYHKADVESEEDKQPCKYTLEIESEEDMKIRVVKSANATVKVPYIGEMESGPSSNGYVTNVEGILNRIKKIVEDVRDTSDDESEKDKAKNILKKIARIQWGRDKAKMIIEDPTGNSSIISDKAKKEPLKVKKAD